MRAIGPPLTDDERNAWIAAARSMIGVKWRHQGRDPVRGVDCAGLLLCAMWQVPRDAVDVPDTAYGREPYRGTLEKVMQANFGDPIPKDQMRVGDAVVMKFNNGQPSHVGILGDYLYGGFSLIHAYARGDKRVVEHRLDAEWAGYIAEVYRP